MKCPKCGNSSMMKHLNYESWWCPTCEYVYAPCSNPPKKRAYISITAGKTDVLLTVSLSKSDPGGIFDELKTECGRHLKQGDVINSIQFLEVQG